MRGISVIFLLINCYWFCYEAFQQWHFTLSIINKILMNFERTTGLFSSILWTKLFCVVFLALSCLGTKGVKEEKITWPKIWTVLFAGFVLFFLNWWLLALPIGKVGTASLYIFTLSVGYICLLMAGVWMSRSSVVWGPFSIVWGLAIALVTAMLYKYKDKSDSFLFIIGTLLGGAYEYLCSVFTEIVFGKVFWDYSEIPFNLGGRINLLYCFFWGIAAVVWFKKIYPYISAWIEKIPMLAGKLLTWFLIVFMICNVAVSCIALVRYDERGKGVVAENSIQKWADEHYDDVKMEKIYPNAKATE